MQLAHNDPFRAIDDKRAINGHQGQFAHVDLLLLDFLDGRLGSFAVIDDQAQARAQRRAKGQAPLLTFDDVERRRPKQITDELEACHLVVRDDRKNRSKSGLKSVVVTLSPQPIGLKKVSIGFKLSRQQIRHLLDDGAFGEALADALLLGERIRLGHGRSVVRCRQRLPAKGLEGQRSNTSNP